MSNNYVPLRDGWKANRIEDHVHSRCVSRSGILKVTDGDLPPERLKTSCEDKQGLSGEKSATVATMYFLFVCLFNFKFLADTCPFISMFWTSGDVSSAFQSQSVQPYLHLAEAYAVDTCRPLGHVLIIEVIGWKQMTHLIHCYNIFSSKFYFLNHGKLNRAFLCIICPDPVGIEFECKVWKFSCPVLLPSHRRNTFQKLPPYSWVIFWNNNKQLSS